MRFGKDQSTGCIKGGVHGTAPHFKPNTQMESCKYCDKTFKTQRSLKRHVKSVHGQKKAFQCSKCKRAFNRRDNLNRHVGKVHEKKKSPKPSPPRPEPQLPRPPDALEKDPRECPPHLLSDLCENYRQCYINNWHQIRSRQRGGQFSKVYTIRLERDSDIAAIPRDIFAQQTTAFKINIAFGFILFKEAESEREEVRYYYPSQNGFLFDEPKVVANETDLEGLLEELEGKDWQEYVRERKPNSKWRVALLTNVAFHVYPMVERPIGRGRGSLPKWLIENRGLDALENDKRTGQLYDDNLCYFRCLARHLGCGLRNLEGKTKQLASSFLATLDHPETFIGVTLPELHSLDKLFGIHTFVYSLGKDGKVELVHRPTTRLTKKESHGALKLNLFNSHFSYIKDMAKYSHCYVCRQCEATFPKPHRLRRHEQSCEAKIRFMYPGGVYHSPHTIFDKIEDEGITVDEELKFSKYRATFDIEVYFPKTAELPAKRPKLEWTNEHRLLSVSVASNIPGYETPKCFVVAGEEIEHTQQLVADFVDYLNQIGETAFQLELERYQELKDTIAVNLRPDPAPVDPHLMTHPLQANIPVRKLEAGEHVGFDDDDDSDEETDEETEEDKSFIDDDEEEIGQEDHSFYRRINQELDLKTAKVGKEQEPYLARHPGHKKKKTKAQKLLEELDEHISELPVIGFNSGKYDINVLKEVLIPTLVQNQGIQFTIKKNQAYLALKSGKLKFLDVSNFLAAGSSYAGFLKAYDCSQEKGHFPYKWLDSLDKLDHPRLPEQSAFSSWLRNTTISAEEYAQCQEAWQKEGMETMRDFLVWYNNLDVSPFLEALEKMSNFWKTKGIDMVKEAISLPGLAFQFEMGFLKQQGVHLSSFHSEPLYQLFRNNMVGGPSIIFKRYAEAKVTNIRSNPAKPVKKIVGYDANGLYLWALCQPMPVGLYTHWQYSSQECKLEPTFPWRAADEWLSWVSRDIVNLRTRLTNTEKRLGDCQLPVDGFDPSTNTPYEFMGCFWHGCTTCFPPDDPHPTRGETYGYWYKKTQEKLAYLEHIGHPAVIMWECEWKEKKKEHSEINQYLNQQFPGRAQRWQKKSPEKIIQAVEDGSFFGTVEVDIHVPTELKGKFSEMTPIFKNVEITRDVIGPHMRQFAENHDIMSRPRRSLIGSYFGQKILLATPLLKFYLEEGLKVTHVYQAIQWTPKACFGPFGDFVSESRREADADPHQKILGETAKTVGNAGYGRFLMDVTRHQKVAYVKDERKVGRAINSFLF
ncbi:uncharacterized protein LOC144644372 [Oculina patagonica]